MGLEKEKEGLMALICHKIVTKCSILHGGKGPGSPPWLQRYLAKSQFSFVRKLIQFNIHLCNKKRSMVLGKSYFSTVGSRLWLASNSFGNKHSLLSAVKYCHKELSLRCCKNPRSVFDSNICQKVIFIWWKQPSNLIQ